MAVHPAADAIISAVGFVLIIAPFYSYYLLLTTTHKKLHKSTLRISVLSCRTALFLPTYSVIMWISLVVPFLYLPMQVPIALAEGYSFYSYFAMITTNLGGSNATICLLDKLFEGGKRPLCPCCCPSKGSEFYKRVTRALWHFFNSRSVLVAVTVILQMIFTFDDNLSSTAIRRLKIVAYLFTFATLILLGNGFGSLVMFYETVYDASANVMGTFKILLLKFSVGLIVIQGLIEEILYALGVITVEGTVTFTPEDRAQRFYCFVVITEYAFLSIAVYYAYSTEIIPRETVDADVEDQISVVTGGKSAAAGGGHAKSTDLTVVADARMSSIMRHSEKVGAGGATNSRPIEVDGTNTIGSANAKVQERVHDHGDRDSYVNDDDACNISLGDYARMVFALSDVWNGLEPMDSPHQSLLSDPYITGSTSHKSPLHYQDQAESGGNVI